MPLITYREAVRHALAEEIERDRNVVVMGEEVAQFNGAYKVTEGLLGRFGTERVVDTPISEAGFIGMGIGASMLGVRPVMELMFWSFYSVAFDQILNNAANVRYMSGGQIHCPIVIRGPANGGTNVGATHSHTPENVLANHPGVKVVVPATAYDAKGLLKSAIRDNDPVFFLENTMLYGEKGEVPTEEYLVPLGLADVKRQGTDLTIVTYGRSVLHSLAARHPRKGAQTFGRSGRPAFDPSARHRHRPRIRGENPPRVDRRGAEALRQRRLRSSPT
jgi:pyruvate dehydrogenase E1 component beta subunit